MCCHSFTKFFVLSISPLLISDRVNIPWESDRDKVVLLHFGIVAAIGPMALNVMLMGFELLVAFLQAYVFAILTCIYLHDAVHLH